MIYTTAQVDSWTATQHRHLDAILRAAVEIVDHGPTSDHVELRWPSELEKRGTDRADGNFLPTPQGQSRRTGRSDPTLGKVLAWEGQVQQTMTDIAGVLNACVSMLGHMGLTARDEHDRTMTPPAEPPTRTTDQGREVIDVDPAACRRHTLVAVRWMGAAVDALAEQMRRAEGDQGEHVADQARVLDLTVKALHRSIVPPASPRQKPLVYCGCGELAKYRKLALCQNCYRRMKESA